MLRTILAVSAVSLYIFFVAPFSILCALLRGKPDIIYQAGRLGSRIGLRLAGIKLEIEGQEHLAPGKTYLFVVNHQSNCDPPVLLVAIPRDVRFIVKKELQRIPLLSSAMRIARFVFIDRKDRVNALQEMSRVVAQMRQGDSFLVFPEGTRTRTGQMGPFKKGPFIMALQAGISIIPTSLSGSFEVMPPTQFRIRPGTIRVTFHAPVETRGLDPNVRDILMKGVWETVASGCEAVPNMLKASSVRN
jgi:1-acyl-sn-glycerol-3-phosphate acyltransferase